MKKWFHTLFAAIVCTLNGAGSGTTFASNSELDFILHDAGALVTSVPRLEVSADAATLSYIGDLNCNTNSNLQNCQRYDLICNFSRPDVVQVEYIGIGVSYVPFAKMIKGSKRFPFVIYTDKVVRRYNQRHDTDVSFDNQKTGKRVAFSFAQAKRIGEFDAGNYSISWETSSKTDAGQLLEMLSSGELLLIAVPESTSTLTFYHRLPPSVEGDEGNLADEFASLCISNWEMQR